MAESEIKIAHVTSVHPLSDVRILYKECESLANNGFKVSLIGFGETPSNYVGKVDIVSLGPKFTSRIERYKQGARLLKEYVLREKFDLVHFHDPELLTGLVGLRKQGIATVFDVHEDLPGQILGKYYIPALIRKPAAYFIKRIENWYASKCSGLVTATPFIGDLFKPFNENVAVAKNLPLKTEFSEIKSSDLPKNRVLYIGGISKIRGIIELLDALQILNGKVRLDLAGPFNDAETEVEVRDHPAWKYVDYHGVLNRKEVAHLLSQSSLGMVTLHKNLNYLNSIPVKLFEYLISGLYVIASDFEYWRKISKDLQGVRFVNEQNVKEIAEAIETSLQSMESRNELDRSTVLNSLTWNNEANAIVTLYNKILNKP